MNNKDGTSPRAAAGCGLASLPVAYVPVSPASRPLPDSVGMRMEPMNSASKRLRRPSPHPSTFTFRCSKKRPRVSAATGLNGNRGPWNAYGLVALLPSGLCHRPTDCDAIGAKEDRRARCPSRDGAVPGSGCQRFGLQLAGVRARAGS
jgi:hypothetical protein